MLVTVDTPAWARADPSSVEEEKDLIEALTYRDLRVDYELARLGRTKRRMVNWMGQIAYDAKVASLKAERRKSLVRREGGVLRFPAGLAHRISGTFRDVVVPPEPSPIPWGRSLDFTFRPYQREGVELLMKHRHGCLELPTGSGKTYLAMKAVRDVGLRAVVASPFSSIVRQTYDEFRRYLGPSRVGLYGDGKHDLSRLITVATVQALHRVTPESEEGKALGEVQVLVGDEAHLWPADTLARVCLDLMGRTPYRFFLTGTHLRGDGRQLVLDGLTGEVLLSKSVEEFVHAGWLARPKFRMLTMRGGVPPREKDEPDVTTRRCLLTSPRVVSTVADLVNRMVRAGKSTLVLIDELEQFVALLPYLRYPVRLAYRIRSGVGKGKRAVTIPEEYRKSNPYKLVREFNEKKFPILVGTSCITTGADVKGVAAGVYWRGGRSEVDVRQGVGRFLRVTPDKKEVVIFDIDVTDGGLAHKHARIRADVYRNIFPDYREVACG